MTSKVLFVDDDPLILAGFKRTLPGKFELSTATGGEKALTILNEKGPYAVVVVDYNMPGMNGVQLLEKIQSQYPDIVRIMLTGNAHVDVSMDAVNSGQIFRFLLKPCPVKTLSLSLQDAIRQYELVKTEQEFIQKTLKGCVEVLTDVLSISSPAAFGKASRVSQIMVNLAKKLWVKDPWEFEIAGMLCTIGCLTLPTDILDKTYHGEELSEKEKEMYESHAATGHDLLVNIPRLRNVAEMIEYQHKSFDGSGPPEGGGSGTDIPSGARALCLAIDYDTLVSSGMDNHEAIKILNARAGKYDPDILSELASTVLLYEPASVKFDELKHGMILADNIPTLTNSMIIAKGQRVTDSCMVRLRNIHKTAGIKEPIKVLVPLETQAAGIEKETVN